MLDVRIQVGPVVGAYRACAICKKPSDAEVAGRLVPQERRIQATVSLTLFGSAVTVDTSRICFLRGPNE
jgi:hypothetical protein